MSNARPPSGLCGTISYSGTMAVAPGFWRTGKQKLTAANSQQLRTAAVLHSSSTQLRSHRMRRLLLVFAVLASVFSFAQQPAPIAGKPAPAPKITYIRAGRLFDGTSN